jgi:hypothetical protein
MSRVVKRPVDLVLYKAGIDFTMHHLQEDILCPGTWLPTVGMGAEEEGKVGSGS